MQSFLTAVLPAKITVKTPINKDVEVDKIEIYKVVDEPYAKTATAYCRNHPNRIVLWKDAEYDAAGQWTDTDVVNRVIQLYTK